MMSNAWTAIDVNFCEIEKPAKGNSMWRTMFSHKHQAHGIKYTVITRLSDGLACYVGQPTPGSVHDKRMADEEGVSGMLANDEWILGDKGYYGLERTHLPYKESRGNDLYPSQKAWNYLVESQRVVVENFFTRTKNFGVLAQPFRWSLSLHGILYRIIVWISCVELIINKY